MARALHPHSLIAALLAAFVIGCTGSIETISTDAAVPPPRPLAPFEPQPPALPRLTQAQYRNSLTQLVGTLPPTDLEADTNPYLFFTIGAALTTISERGVQQYADAAHTVADALFAEGPDSTRRDAFVGCDAEEATCREAFLARVGRSLFRRPLDADSLALWTSAATVLADGDAWRGLRLAFAGMLQSPRFLYRAEFGVPNGDSRTLDDFEIASRLSFLLWDTAPDETLLDAAESGSLATEAGIYEQAMRLIEDPRSHTAVQNFFAQYLDLGRLDHLALDPALYPQFTPTLARSMRTEIELLVEDLVFRQDRDVRELFFSRTAFVNDELAALYGLEAPDASPVAFVPVTLPDERAGILTSGAFLAMNAHPSETSPTLRGKYVRERVLCQSVLPPPDNVNTDLPPSEGGMPRTLRERLELHRENPECRSCHEFMDPPGFLFEHFDSVGAWRDTEPGGAIDSSGGIDDIPLEGAADLALVLRDDPRVSQCMVQQLYRHAMGRLDADREFAALSALHDEFEASGFRFRDLLLAFVTSESFRTVAASGDE